MTTFNLDVPSDLTVDLKLPIGHVELVPGPAGSASVELTASGGLGDQLIDESRVELIDHRLVVHVPERGGRGLGLFRARFLGTIHVRIVVPEDTELVAGVAAADVEASVALRAVEVRSASGNVRLGDVHGPTSVHVASGQVHVGDVDGDLTCATASGDVRTGNVAGSTSVRTASGEVAVGRLGGDARLRSVSGDLTVRELSRGAVDVASTSGDVQLRVAAGLQIHLDVSSVSGELHSDLGGGDVSGSDIDLSLRARSVSGDITITRARIVGMAQVV